MVVICRHHLHYLPHTAAHLLVDSPLPLPGLIDRRSDGSPYWMPDPILSGSSSPITFCNKKRLITWRHRWRTGESTCFFVLLNVSNVVLIVAAVRAVPFVVAAVVVVILTQSLK